MLPARLVIDPCPWEGQDTLRLADQPFPINPANSQESAIRICACVVEPNRHG